MANKIDVTRHFSVIDPAKLPPELQIDVIGVGATGSHVAASLARYGFSNPIVLRDPDIIEAHNCANQVPGIPFIGRKKAEAMAAIIKNDTGLAVQARVERVTGATDDLGKIVFLLVDSMRTRKEIFEGALQHNLVTELVIETRLDVAGGRIYLLNPNRQEHVDGWNGAYYDDSAAQVSACGTGVTVGGTARIIAEMAVWKMIEWVNGERDTLPNEILLDIKNNEISSRRFVDAPGW